MSLKSFVVSRWTPFIPASDFGYCYCWNSQNNCSSHIPYCCIW